ncbi:SMC family ATPase [Rhodococcus spelaei]|uniref:Nuclease SbcCD subunit C n=1 Tax=Rhodococcus spelaei TaxID=2546320 RepID=A0A541BNJ7_9NOCA|nr:SMC family ATPase [Rhodococcus spelaei]TQF73889.1 SMC family ATPase [Rhodococcus spelaei]
MRLHTLEATAFGPFGRTVSVDFDTLGADGLFLLHGQTGAGKTTILDAVAFALYGRVPGARQEGKRLLSDHADPGTAPKVVLEATIGGRRVRITRSPEFQRAKLRGTGTTKENAKASLEWLDGEGENLTRLDEIGEVVGRLLGMSADQFFQVVLLPQGDFARFLRADTEERGKLLERLFDTARFGTVEEWFADRRRESAARIESSRRSVDIAVAKVSTAAGIEAGADADPLTWARKLLADATEARDTAAVALLQARAVDIRAADSLSEAQRVHELQRRAARARADLTAHQAAATERSALASELSRARAAEPVAALRAQADGVANDAAAQRRRLADLEDGVAKVGEGSALLARLSWPAAASDRDTVAAAVREWTAEVTRLDALIERASGADEAQSEVERDQARRSELDSAATELGQRSEAIPALVGVAEAELGEARSAAARVDGLSAELARLVDARDAATATAGQRRTVAELAQARADLRDLHQQARSDLLDLRKARIDGMAAELAGGLVDGAPCAVCGSDVHPAPAQPADTAVSKADEDAASAVEQRRAADLDAAAGRLIEAERILDGLVTRAGDRDPDELGVLVRDATDEHARARTLAGRVDELAAGVAALRAEGEGHQERIRAVDAERAGLAERIGAGSALVARVRAEIAAAAGADEDLRTRRDRVDALAAAVSRLGELRIQVTAVEENVSALEVKVSAAAAAAGFASPQDALAAVREPGRIAELESVLAHARDTAVRAESVLAEPEVLAVAAAAPADPEAAAAERTRVGELLGEAISAEAKADDRVLDLERLVGQLERELDALGPALRRHDELAALADVIAGRGQNSRKMSLSSYVLAARLEEVALSASVRLRRMSGGRYEFVHEDGAGPRGKRGGLGLDIRDDYTGVVRSAKTLSGGESFLASLSLALGLADVVAAESGGVVLDTMFIDEGFGTLDPDALESVMGVLDELREGGRVVGIVSHVDEMRARIPSRLHVIRGRSGSSVEVVAG